MIRTTLCYIERDGAYLMLHRNRKRDDANHDKWLGIGGHIEPGETPMQCILRETLEETGLTLLDCRERGLIHFHAGDWYEDMYLFTAARFTGDLIDCSEGELAWVEKRRVPDLPLWEGDRVFLRLLEEGAPWFELALDYDDEGAHLVRATLNGAPLPLC